MRQTVISGRIHKQRKLTGRRCLCAACGHYFASVTAFDLHQLLSPDRMQVICLHPRDAGLVEQDIGGFCWWSLPGIERGGVTGCDKEEQE
jgi:hypothetical protein